MVGVVCRRACAGRGEACILLEAVCKFYSYPTTKNSWNGGVELGVWTCRESCLVCSSCDDGGNVERQDS